MRTTGNAARAHSSPGQGEFTLPPKTAAYQGWLNQGLVACFPKPSLSYPACTNPCGAVRWSTALMQKQLPHWPSPGFSFGSVQPDYTRWAIKQQMVTVRGVCLNHSWALQLDNLIQTQKKNPKQHTLTFGPHQQLLNTTEALPHLEKKKKVWNSPVTLCWRQTNSTFPSMCSLLSHWNPK